jgi:hypothetical protein
MCNLHLCAEHRVSHLFKKLLHSLADPYLLDYARGVPAHRLLGAFTRTSTAQLLQTRQVSRRDQSIHRATLDLGMLSAQRNGVRHRGSDDAHIHLQAAGAEFTSPRSEPRGAARYYWQRSGTP